MAEDVEVVTDTILGPVVVSEPIVDSEVVSGVYEDIAQEVLAGRWGRGHNRTNKLVAAGYDPKLVNEEIRKILGLVK